MPESTPVRVTTLPSGLTVVTERMDRVETVSFGAYVASGTRHERAEENGVSHFLEHMAFKGTERRSAARIAEEIEDVGGHINAYTAREQTAYYVKLLKEDLGLGVDIIGDILTHSSFAPEELERERGVRGRVVLVPALEPGQEVEISLPGDYVVTPKLGQAIKTVRGVERVEER